MLVAIQVVGAIAILLLVSHIFWAWQFKGFINYQIQALATPVDAALQPHNSLPAIVKKFALRSQAATSAQLIRICQTGEMRLRPDSAWLPFTAVQYFAVQHPEFVWLAQFKPPLSITVIDSYLAGCGHLEARLLGSIPVTKATGIEVDRGELMRYLAELAYCPDALLFNLALIWREIDEHRVEVSAGQGKSRSAVQLLFNGAGDIIEIFTPDRPRQVGNRIEHRPWHGYYRDYQTLSGYRVPLHSEVSWELNTGVFTYWRGRITALEADPKF